MRVAAIAHPLSIAAVEREPGRLERAHVPGHAGLGGPQLLHQLAHTELIRGMQKP